jgi:hypothetical protein
MDGAGIPGSTRAGPSMRRDSRRRHSPWLLAVAALDCCSRDVRPRRCRPVPARLVASVAADIGRFTPHGAAIVQGVGPRFRDDGPDCRGLAARPRVRARTRAGARRLGDADACLGGVAAARVALRRRARGARHRIALRPAHLVGRRSHSGRPRLRAGRARRRLPHRRDPARAPRVLLLECAAALHARRRAPGDALFHLPPAQGATACAPAALTPCACLDFIPAPNCLWFSAP